MYGVISASKKVVKKIKMYGVTSATNERQKIFCMERRFSVKNYPSVVSASKITRASNERQF
jgi:hypothetical protein